MAQNNAKGEILDMISKKLSLISNIITMVGMLLAIVLYHMSDTLACFIVVIGVIIFLIYAMYKKYDSDPANKYSEYSLKKYKEAHKTQFEIVDAYTEFINDLRYQGLILPIVHDTLITQGQEYINRAYAGGRIFARERSENNELTMFEILLSDIENLYLQNEYDEEFRSSLRNTHMYISTFLEQHGIHIQSDVDIYAPQEMSEQEMEIGTVENATNTETIETNHEKISEVDAIDENNDEQPNVQE